MPYPAPLESWATDKTPLRGCRMVTTEPVCASLPGRTVNKKIPEQIQRWTAKRRTALVLPVLKGETSAQEAARKHGMRLAEIEEWKERFLSGAENALRSRPKEDGTLKDEHSTPSRK